MHSTESWTAKNELQTEVSQDQLGLTWKTSQVSNPQVSNKRTLSKLKSNEQHIEEHLEAWIEANDITANEAAQKGSKILKPWSP